MDIREVTERSVRATTDAIIYLLSTVYGMPRGTTTDSRRVGTELPRGPSPSPITIIPTGRAAGVTA